MNSIYITNLRREHIVQQTRQSKPSQSSVLKHMTRDALYLSSGPLIGVDDLTDAMLDGKYVPGQAIFKEFPSMSIPDSKDPRDFLKWMMYQQKERLAKLGNLLSKVLGQAFDPRRMLDFRGMDMDDSLGDGQQRPRGLFDDIARESANRTEEQQIRKLLEELPFPIPTPIPSNDDIEGKKAWLDSLLRRFVLWVILFADGEVRPVLGIEISATYLKIDRIEWYRKNFGGPYGDISEMGQILKEVELALIDSIKWFIQEFELIVSWFRKKWEFLKLRLGFEPTWEELAEMLKKQLIQAADDKQKAEEDADALIKRLGWSES